MSVDCVLRAACKQLAGPALGCCMLKTYLFYTNDQAHGT